MNSDIDEIGPKVDKIEHKITSGSKPNLLSEFFSFLYEYKLYTIEFVAIFFFLILTKPKFICTEEIKTAVSRKNVFPPPSGEELTTRRRISIYQFVKWQFILFILAVVTTICFKYYQSTWKKTGDI